MNKEKISNLVVFERMASQNLPSLTASVTMVGAHSHNRGGIVEMGISRELLMDIIMNDNKHTCILYCVESEAFKEAEKAAILDREKERKRIEMLEGTAKLYRELHDKIAPFYDEETENDDSGGLLSIGEICALHLGYL